MKIGKMLIVVLVTAITMFVLAGIWHEVIMAHVYNRKHVGGHGGTQIIFVAYLILAMFMTYLFSQWKHRSDSLGKGALFGALIGLLWVFPHELAMAGAHGDAVSYVLFNAGWHMIEQGSGGVALVLMYRLKINQW